MNIFKFSAKRQFKKDMDGNILFFPWGMLGKGYILPPNFDLERLLFSVSINWALCFAYIVIYSIFNFQGKMEIYVNCLAILIASILQIRNFLQVKRFKVSVERLKWNDTI